MDKKIIFGISISALVLVTILPYTIFSSPGYPEAGLFLIVLVIVLLALYIIYVRASSIRKGMPAEDELSRKVNYKAGYYAFISAIFVPLALAFYVEEAPAMGWPTLIARHALELDMLLVGMAFVISYILLSWRGIKE